jgi:DNA-binding CsgD family transcriptional regulator
MKASHDFNGSPIPAGPATAPLALTRREQQILAHLAEGYRDKDIGDRLSIGVSTVRTHVRKIYERLHARSRAEAVARFLSVAHGSRATLGGVLLAIGATLGLAQGGQLYITVKNPLPMARPAETIPVLWPALRQAAPWLTPGQFQVTEQPGGNVILCQEVDLDGDGMPDEAVFQAGFAAGESKRFAVQPGHPAEGSFRVSGRLVPERKDDFAWENDRIAFRMYGRRLEDELISSGVDIWCKRTRSLIIDRWYKLGDYHRDHGEGLDCYKVGPARGCGGTAILKDGKLYASRNFTKSRIIASGPIRLIFELTYEPWNAGGVKAAETKRVTLDAGENLNRFECFFVSEGSAELPVAVGLQEHGQVQTEIHAEEGWMRVWEPTDDKAVGRLGVGFVAGPSGCAETKQALGHALAVTSTASGKPVVFYAGAGWEKSGDFPNVQSWDKYLALFAKRVRSPLQVSISNQ